MNKKTLEITAPIPALTRSPRLRPARSDSLRVALPLLAVFALLLGVMQLVVGPEAVFRAGRVLAIELDRERLLIALLASNEELGLSRLRLVETADRERSRSARDLHDGLQVQLVLLALEAQQIANTSSASSYIASAATELRQRNDEAAADLRRLVHDVLPAALVERGLSAAAEDLVDRLAIPATLTHNVDDAEIGTATAQTAYLSVAEALTNAVKHSGASSVRVDLERVGDRLIVAVIDDGRGGAKLDLGTGLKGLADRIDTLGGSFELISSPAGAPNCGWSCHAGCDRRGRSAPPRGHPACVGG